MDNLQQVAIDLIVSSPEPVRSAWDEEKMAELVASVAENGVIVPIKVRPIDGGKLEIVYGHRRVEAARRVGFDAVPAVVEVLTPRDAHIQAGIENKQRDDMTIADEGRWYQSLMQKYGMTVPEIAQEIGYAETWIYQCIAAVRDDAMAPIVGNARYPQGVPDAVHKATWIRNKVPEGLRSQVAEKVAKEDLTSRQTKQLTEAIAQAPTEQARKRLLEWEYSPVIHHPETVREHGAHSPMWQGNGPTKQQAWDATPEVAVIVKGVLDSLDAFRKLMREVNAMADGSKFSPEARQFMVERLRKFRAEIDKTINELEV